MDGCQTLSWFNSVYINRSDIECVRTCDQESYLFIATKDGICIKKEFNSHRINVLLQHGGLFIVHSSNMADMASCEHTLYGFEDNHFRSVFSSGLLLREFRSTRSTNNPTNLISITLIKLLYV